MINPIIYCWLKLVSCFCIIQKNFVLTPFCLYVYILTPTCNTHIITWFRTLIFLAKTWNDFNCFKNVHNVTLTHQDWYVQKLFFAKTFPAHYFRQANVEMIMDINFAVEKYYLRCVELYFNLIEYWSL